MNSSQRRFGFLVATIIVTLVLLGSAFWSIQTPEVRANLAAASDSFLPVVMGVEQGPPPPPSRTPTLEPTSTVEPTNTPTATATVTSTPTNTSTPTVTSTATATATATLTGSETPVPPEIKRFDAEPEMILSGGETTLSWKINGDFDLVKLDPGNIDVTGVTETNVSPTVTTEYTLTAYYLGSASTRTRTVTIGELGGELLVYNWNGEVPTSEGGFPKHIPPQENGDWTSPIDYENGTFYFYVRIRGMPEPKDMQLQYCVWQDGLQSGEQCAAKGKLTGDPGTVLTWSSNVQDMWSKAGRPPIDWSRARYRDAIAIKNKSGKPVSPIFDWSGEIPREWFPLDWHFMVVVVESGKVFSGWENYPSPDPVPVP